MIVYCDSAVTHAKKSLPYHQNSPWTKKNANNMFDVTMGSYDGAETCESIGAYMLSLIAPTSFLNFGAIKDNM